MSQTVVLRLRDSFGLLVRISGVGLLLAATLVGGPGQAWAQRSRKTGAAADAARSRRVAKDDAQAKVFPALLPLPREAQLLPAPSPAAFAAVDADVFDLTQGTKSGSIGTLPKDTHAKRALSPDGRYFAFANEADNLTFVEVRDSTTGQKAFDFRYTTEQFQRVELLRFVTHNRLIVAAPMQSKLSVFVLNAADGRKLKEFSVERVDADKLGISANGRLLAVAGTSTLIVYDLARGQPFAQMTKPPQAISGFLFVRGLAVSPDSNEIAALFSGKGYRLVVWDMEGQVKEDYSLGLRIGAGYNEGEPIVWRPDGQGWLLHGNHYFDRRVKSVAWTMQMPPAHHYHHCWLDNDHVLATQGDFSSRQLVSVPVPSEEIAAAGKALESNEPALLRPGQKISLDVQVGETRFSDRETTTAALTEVLSKRFAENDIAVTPSQKTVLHVKYSEVAGEQLRVTKGRGPFGEDTGQRVQETVLLLAAKLVSPGSPKPIWEISLRRGNPRIVRSQTVNDAEVRKATFQMLEYILSAEPIPYYIPAKDGGPQLPLITKLSSSPGS